MRLVWLFALKIVSGTVAQVLPTALRFWLF